MHEKFDENRFDLVRADRVHIPNYEYGHNRIGELDVWIVSDPPGEAFVRQLTVDGAAGPPTQGVYSLSCSFLVEKLTGKHFFLEHDDRGFTINDDDFFGAEAYLGPAAKPVETWLASERAA